MPVLMVLMMVTNDFLSMSLTGDRATPATLPSRWRMRNISAAAVVLSICKLGFSTAFLAFGTFQLGLGAENCRRWRSLCSCSGTLMAALPWRLLVAVFVAAAGFALILDQIKLPVMSRFKIE